jgi:hypothetical protein
VRWPQRLKPTDCVGVYGTAEAVPLSRTKASVCELGKLLRHGALGFGSLAISVVLLVGCGYHAVGAATHVPAGTRTIAVPIFQSKVQAYRTETVFTQAIVRELNTRTKYRVLTASGDGTFAGSGTDADATLRGTILSQTVAPLTYDPSSGQTSSYLVTITASVVLTSRDGTVLFKNNAFAWREQYQSTQDLSGFLQEDGFAVQRMARDFSQAVVSEMLESL